MSVSINDNGEISAAAMNSYLGASVGNQLHFTGVYGAPNFSLNQIFFSEPSTDPPEPQITVFGLGSLRGLAFGIYQNPQRTLLHGNIYSNDNTNDDNDEDPFPVPLLPIFIGYFGFGTSGVLNPSNKGFPLVITIESLSYQNITVSIKNGDGFLWDNISLNGPLTMIQTSTADGIRILSNSNREDVIVDLTVAPNLKQSGSGGVGRHEINIRLLPNDLKLPPIDGPPIDDGGGGEILDDGINRPPIDDGLDGIR